MRRLIESIIRSSPFNPVPMGHYIRLLYFFKYIKQLPLARFQNVLDAGCGNGDFSLELARRYPHLSITAYDIEDHIKNKKTSISGSVHFQTQDLLTLSDKQRFDFCLCIDVLEHIRGNRKVMENIFHALKPGGYFYVHIPRPPQHERYLFPRRWFNDFVAWADENHVGERYTVKEIQWELQKIGFLIVKAHCSFNFCGRLAWELDKLTSKNLYVNVIAMPFLKIMAHLDFWLPKSRTAAILVIAQKPVHN